MGWQIHASNGLHTATSPKYLLRRGETGLQERSGHNIHSKISFPAPRTESQSSRKAGDSLVSQGKLLATKQNDRILFRRFQVLQTVRLAKGVVLHFSHLTL